MFIWKWCKHQSARLLLCLCLLLCAYEKATADMIVSLPSGGGFEARRLIALADGSFTVGSHFGTQAGYIDVSLSGSLSTTIFSGPGRITGVNYGPSGLYYLGSNDSTNVPTYWNRAGNRTEVPLPVGQTTGFFAGMAQDGTFFVDTGGGAYWLDASASNYHLFTNASLISRPTANGLMTIGRGLTGGPRLYSRGSSTDEFSEIVPNLHPDLAVGSGVLRRITPNGEWATGHAFNLTNFVDSGIIVNANGDQLYRFDNSHGVDVAAGPMLVALFEASDGPRLYFQGASDWVTLDSLITAGGYDLTTLGIADIIGAEEMAWNNQGQLAVLFTAQDFSGSVTNHLYISGAVVPEPGSLLLLCSGMLLLVFYRRRTVKTPDTDEK